MRLLKKVVKWLIPSWLFMQSGNRASSSLYLTFDDGPNAGVTDELLDLLEAHNVCASFFVIGLKLKENISIGESIISEGHLVGNHSYDHIYFGKKSLVEQIKQINKAQLIIDSLGQKFRGFRAPQGRWSFKLFLWLAINRFQAVHWSYDSLDYEIKDSQLLIDRLKASPVKGGDIVLFHDDSRLCIEVLTEMIPVWKQQGFEFKLLSDLP